MNPKILHSKKSNSHLSIDHLLKSLITTQGSNTMLGRIGQTHDPFKVLISTILSARAKDEVTEIIAQRLFLTYPTCHELANALQIDVITIIRKIGFFNLKSKHIIETARLIRDTFRGKVPDTLEELITLPGVGRKVANCVLVYAYHKDAIPVDIHVHRISNRLGLVRTKTPEQTEQKLLTCIPQKHWQTINDTFVTHGKKTCLPVSPKCSQCPIFSHCQRNGVVRSR